MDVLFLAKNIVQIGINYILSDEILVLYISDWSFDSENFYTQEIREKNASNVCIKFNMLAANFYNKSYE